MRTDSRIGGKRGDDVAVEFNCTETYSDQPCRKCKKHPQSGTLIKIEVVSVQNTGTYEYLSLDNPLAVKAIRKAEKENGHGCCASCAESEDELVIKGFDYQLAA